MQFICSLANYHDFCHTMHYTSVCVYDTHFRYVHFIRIKPPHWQRINDNRVEENERDIQLECESVLLRQHKNHYEQMCVIFMRPLNFSLLPLNKERQRERDKLMR